MTTVDLAARGTQSSEPAAALAGRGTWARLGWHVLAYVVLLVALAAVARPGVATIDEGAYGIQARLVADGTWAYPEGLSRFDPDGRFFPITLSTEAGGRWYTYVKHPAVPAVMAVVTRVAGEGAGLVVLPLVGAVVAAIMAWGLAAEWDRRRAPLAFWLAAGSPIAFHAYITWAHTLSAACAGAAFWAMVRLGRRGPSVARVAWLSVALAAGVLVRSEGVLVAMAVLAVLVVVVLRARGARALLASIAVPTGAVGVVLWLERIWMEAIVGGAAPRELRMRSAPEGLSFLEARFQAAWISVLRGSGDELFAARGLILPIGLAVGVALVLRSARSERHDVELALGSVLAAFLLVLTIWPGHMLSGLVPASPLLVLGVALALRRRGDPPLTWLVWSMALLAIAVLATQYAVGGGFQWGGRFFVPLLVPAASVAALGLGALVGERPAEVRRRTTGLLVALGLVAGLTPIVALGATRADVEPLYAEVAASASPANVTTSEQLPRLMWREDLDWLVAQPHEVVALLESMREGGVERITAVVRTDMPLTDLERWPSVTDRGVLGDTGLRILVLRQ